MKTGKSLLLLAALTCFGLLGFALYLQHGLQMQPCPLCVIQRYVFAGVALACLIALLLPRGGARAVSVLAALGALGGAGVAGWHIYVKANPTVSCGIDPLETALNRIPTAELLPFLFKADGLCSADYAPILGLSIPQWSLVWFVILAIGLAWNSLRRA